MTQIKQLNATTGEITFIDLEPEEQALLDTFDPVPGLYEGLRAERNRLLAETDWVSLKYYDLGQPVPTEWTEYRQALRDLPANTEDPANPVWPTKPS